MEFSLNGVAEFAEFSELLERAIFSRCTGSGWVMNLGHGTKVCSLAGNRYLPVFSTDANFSTPTESGIKHKNMNRPVFRTEPKYGTPPNQ